MTGLTVVVRTVAQFMIICAAGDGNSTSVLLSNYRISAGFDPQAAVLVNLTGNIVVLDAATNGQGDTWLVWDRKDGNGSIIEGLSYYARFWSPSPVNIATNGSDPTVIMDENGTATVAYRPDAGRALIDVRSFRDGRWLPPVVLFDLDGDIVQFDMVCNPVGNITAAVLLTNSTSLLTTFETNGTAWRTAVPITDPVQPGATFRLAMGILGDAMIVLQEPPKSESDPYHFSFTKQPLDGNWTEVEDMGALGGGSPLPYYELSSTRTDYWLLFARTEIGTTGESRTWADQFKGVIRGGAELIVDSWGVNGTVSTPYIEIAGRAEPFSQVTIGDVTVSADKWGHFSAFVPLHKGKNTFIVSTVDSLGRQAQVTVTITYQPEEGPLPWAAIAGVGLAAGAVAVAGAYLVIRKRRSPPQG